MGARGTDHGHTAGRRPGSGTDEADAPGPRAAEAAERQSFVRHELRTPLAVMRPLLDMLLDGSAGELDERQLGHLRMLERNLERLGAMIASVVDSGWLEVAAVPAREAALDVAGLVDTALADVRTAVPLCPQLDVEVAPELPVVRGDPLRLRRALRNVLVNACTFTPPAGAVHVTVRGVQDGDGVTICVSDSGCGIPAEELGSVFDFGFQGEAARAREVRGLGLGLAVARELVEAGGGRIRLESVSGEGTKVWLDLPREGAALA